MKKFINILLCLSIIFSSFSITAFASEALTVSETAPYEAGLVQHLEIITPNSADFWGKTVTREAFAKYVYNIAKSYDSFDKASYYSDVEKGSELETAVNYLVKSGVLSVSENRLFRPDDAITFYEVCKMLAVVAGYEPYAQYVGGYPAGYLKVINDLDIADGINSFDVITNKTAAIMIYNTLLANTYDFYSVTKDGPSYTGKHTEDVITKYFNIYTAEGIVNKKNMTDINSETRAEKGIIDIDGVLYNDLIEEQILLGYYVEAYVYDNDAGKDSVVYADISYDNDILKIDVKDVENVTSQEIKYYDEDGKTKTAKLSAPKFVKNGSLVRDISDLSRVQKGYYTLVSTSGKSSYNTVLITEYEIFVVGMLDSTKFRIYDKYNRASYVDLDDKELESAVVILNDQRVNFMHIEDNDVLTVMRSSDGETVTAVISNEFKEGIVDYIGGKNSDKISVDNVEYTLDVTLANRIGISGQRALVSPGDKVELVFDITGEVADIRKSVNESSKIGYVYDKGEDRGGLVSNAGLKVFTLDGELEILYLEDKVSLNDGKRNSNYKAVFERLGKKENDKVLQPQLIRYSLNSDGKIYSINTADYSDNMSKAKYLTHTLENTKETYRSGLIEPITAINAETVIMQVPSEKIMQEDGEYERYFKLLTTSAFKSGDSYVFEAYNINEDDPYTDVLIYMPGGADDQTKATNYDNTGIVRRTSKMMDAYDDEVYALELFEKGKAVKHMVSPDCVWKDALENDIAQGALLEGDMIRYNFDGVGRISYIEIICRPEDLNYGATLGGMKPGTTYESRFRITEFYVSDKYEGSEMDSGGILSLLTFTKELGGDPDFRMQYSRLNKAIVYDGTKREGERVYIGNIDNITTYDGTGGTDASIVITHASVGSIQTFYIINR